jgi:putative ABC transport system permease protein
MSRLLFRAGVRYHLRHPWQLALALLGVMLGVAVVVAVDVASSSARRAFTLSTEAVTGRATHEITAGPAGIPDSVYVMLRAGLGIDSIAPVIDRYVRVAASTDRPPGADAHNAGTSTAAAGVRVLRLLGVDPFAEAPIRSYVAPASGQLDFGVLLTQRALLLSMETAGAMGLAVGDTVQVTAGTRTSSAVIGGLLEPEDALARRALADLALADIATAQDLAGTAGAIDRIELRLAADANGAARKAAISAALPAGARLRDAAARTDATVRLTRAFETNLTALALVALVFGMFLIYNSVSFSLLQRRPLLGLLRAQGVTARELLTLVLLEAAVLGAVATLAGLLVGAALGAHLVGIVARTVNDLYFTITVATVHLDPLTLGKGALLGVGATVLAALPPAREAVLTAPRRALARAALERSTRGRAARLGVTGLVTLLAAAALLALPSRSLVIGFAALFVLILAAALLTPAATIGIMAAARLLLARSGPVARMAVRGVPAALSRTAPAIAALSVAIAVGIAVTIMIGSFRAGVFTWLERSLQADLYISAPDFGANRADVTLDPALAAQIAELPGVAGVSTYRHTSLLLGDDLVTVIAVDLFPRHEAAFELLDGVPAAAWPAFRRGAVLVSEPLAWRRGLRAGDSITIPADRGDERLAIAAVFRDYASEHGVIFIDRAAWDLRFDDDAVTSVAVFTAPVASADDVLATIRDLPAASGIVARSNRGLREATIVVFDRTFAITGVLRLLSLIVAFVGVTGALMALQLERSREIGVLRTTGLTRGQVWGLVTAQTGLMGLAAAVLSVPLGLAMAWAMVNVINRRSFGWSFEMVVGPAPFVQALAVGLGAALLAGMYPAWRMAALAPADALREE